MLRKNASTNVGYHVLALVLTAIASFIMAAIAGSLISSFVNDDEAAYFAGLFVVLVIALFLPPRLDRIIRRGK